MTLNRRCFLTHAIAGTALLGIGTSSLRADTPATPEDLAWLPAHKLRALIAQQRISPVDVIEAFLSRIETLDPMLSAFSEIDADRARVAAVAAEKAVLKGEALGPLHGVPVTLKQMIAVEGLRTEDGSRAPRDAIPTARLRDAGAIVLGTTTLAGPAAMLGEIVTGAANPWDTSRIAGSSSSGAAASVAAGLCPIALGTDGGGSTRLPAAWCGLVGLHPTVGRVPADDNLQRSQARTSWSGTCGPITRDVRDAAIALTVTAGPHWRHIPSFNGEAPDYLTGLARDVQGLRVAWTKDLNGNDQCARASDQPVITALARAASGFDTLGAEVDEIGLQLGDWYPPFTRLAAELSTGPAYPLLSGAARAWDTLRDADSAPQWVGDIDDALATRETMAAQLIQVFREFDLLVCPTSPRIDPQRDEYRDWLEADTFSPEYTCMTGHMNLLGFPAITIPAGLVQGMPVGLQLIAPPDHDALLLRAAEAFLEAFPPADARERLRV